MEDQIAEKTRWQGLRQWLGIYTRSEKALMEYNHQIKKLAVAILRKKQTLTERPDWMKFEDYKRLRELQKKYSTRRS